MAKAHELPGYNQRRAIELKHLKPILEAIGNIKGHEEAVRQAHAMEAQGDVHAKQIAANAVHQNVTADPQAMRDALANAMNDAVQAGADRASQDTGIDAGTFGGRVNAILGSIDVGAAQIMQTTIGRISNAIADGLINGDSVDQTIQNVQGILDDASRAETIATTQVNYAEAASYLDQISQAGYSEWEWLAYEGACPDCEDAAGPHDISDTDQPPAHPNCRCTVVLPDQSASTDQSSEE